MKKISILLASLFVLSTAFAALKQPIVERLLALKAKEFITGEFITTVSQRHQYVYEHGLDFDALYYDVREETYQTTFVKDTRDSDSKWDDYYGYRTVAVAVFRSQLHRGNTLEETYMQVREDFMKSVAKHEPSVRTALIKLLQRSAETFSAVGSKGSREAPVASLSAPEPGDYGTHCAEVLSKRLSPEQTVKAIGQPPVEVAYEKTAHVVDFDGLKRFALRRWDEGGPQLVKKYQSVIKLALADAIAADASAQK